MRVLYITINESIDNNNGGVSNKLLSKVSAINKKVDFCKYINAKPDKMHTEIRETIVNDICTQVEIGVEQEDQQDDVSFYNKLSEFITKKEWLVDRIIMRYPFASNGLLEFSARHHKKIVFEHNTKEVEELKLHIARKRYASFSFRPSGFRFWYREKKLPLINERTLGPKIFDNAFAGACVTTEIAQFEHRRNPMYKTFVSSNFYNVKDSRIIQKTYNENETLCLGIIVTNMSSWYGLDRLLSSFSKYQSAYKLVLAGIEENNLILIDMISRYKISRNLIVTGKIAKNRLPEFYDQVHICFGSLGLHTIKLNYASTLKVKESISLGIPVAIGYYEEDFHSNPEFKPYYVQLPNDESPVNFDTLKNFAVSFYSENDNQQKLRDLALKYIDVDVKVEQLIKNIS
jgi:hypothetical protein